MRYSDHDVAARYGVDISTVRRWRAEGLLGYLKLGGTVRITDEQLEEFERRSTKLAA